jgi:hypothetical protein
MKGLETRRAIGFVPRYKESSMGVRKHLSILSEFVRMVRKA